MAKKSQNGKKMRVGFGPERGVWLVTPNQAEIIKLTTAARKISESKGGVKKDEADGFKQYLESQKALLEVALSDHFPETIHMLAATFKAAGNLPYQQRREVLSIARDLVVGKLDVLEANLQPGSKDNIYIVNAALAATVGAKLSDAEKLVAFGLQHADVYARTQGPDTIARLVTNWQDSLNSERYSTGGFAAMLTQAGLKDVADVGRIILGKELDQHLLPGEKADDFYKRYLNAYKVPTPDKVIYSWKRTTSELKIKPNQHRMTQDEAIFFHYVALKRLEERMPGSGIARRLAESFHIHDFGRYPEDVLLRQFKETEEHNMPYVVAVMGRGDWNGAFDYAEEPSPITSLQTQLQQLGYALRIVEAEDGEDMQQILKRLDENYAQPGGRKIAAALIFGHGQKEGLYLGSDATGVSLPEYKLTPQHIRDSKAYFVPEPPITLISCSTGVEEGVAQEFSNEGVAVKAPDADTNLRDIKVSRFKDGRLFFEPDYYSPANRHIFIHGRRLSPGVASGYQRILDESAGT